MTSSSGFSVILASLLLLLGGCSRKTSPADVVQARPLVALHTVASETETVESIAQAYSMTVEEVCRLNELSPTATLVTGQKVAVIPPQSSVVLSPQSSVVLSPVQSTETTGTVVEPVDSDFSQQESLETPDIAQEPRKVESLGFVWPVQGKILRRFRSKLPNGMLNEGVNISAPANTAVKAVADGSVIDSGELVLGFGKMVILSLDNGMIAIYGHLQEVSLPKSKEGQEVRVKRGQVIGRVGKTGNVRVPQLHFQLRDSAKKPVNPLKFLPPVD